MPDSELKQKFEELKKKWKEDTEETSSIHEIITHPCCIGIVLMGKDVLPLIFEEYEKELDHWSPVLRMIVDENPVPIDDAGKMEKMREAWMKWGKEHGHI